MSCFGGCLKSLDSEMKNHIENMMPVIEAKIVALIETKIVPMIQEKVKDALQGKEVALSDIVTELKETVENTVEEIKETM